MRMLRTLPASLPLGTAALIEPASVAWHAVRRAGTLADSRQDALWSACIHHGIGAAPFQVVRQGHLRLAAGLIGLQETREQVVGMKHGATEIQSLSETTIVHR